MRTRQVEARTQAVSPESGVGARSAHVASTRLELAWAIRMDPAAWEKGPGGNMVGMLIHFPVCDKFALLKFRRLELEGVNLITETAAFLSTDSSEKEKKMVYEA